MDIKKNRLSTFLKSGIAVLSLLLLCAAGVYYLPKAVTVSNQSGGRELPIYCVNREDKKIALSFDAAWAEGCLMEQKNTDKYYRKVCPDTLCQYLINCKNYLIL